MKTAVSQTWRIQPTSPPSLAVQVDAWHTLHLAPASSRPRIDVIAERVVDGERCYRIVEGAPCVLPWRPVTPDGWTAIAAVVIPSWATWVFNGMISEAG